jgi:hypothetical protein
MTVTTEPVPRLRADRERPMSGESCDSCGPSSRTVSNQVDLDGAVAGPPSACAHPAAERRRAAHPRMEPGRKWRVIGKKRDALVGKDAPGGRGRARDSGREIVRGTCRGVSGREGRLNLAAHTPSAQSDAITYHGLF